MHILGFFFFLLLTNILGVPGATLDVAILTANIASRFRGQARASYPFNMTLSVLALPATVGFRPDAQGPNHVMNSLRSWTSLISEASGTSQSVIDVRLGAKLCDSVWSNAKLLHDVA